MTRDEELRLRLLRWVQSHVIERYSDRSVLSHSEAVEELLEVMHEDPV